MDLSGEAADGVEEPLELGLGAGEASRAGPPVEAPEDGRVPVLAAYPVDLGGDHVEGLVPGALDEGPGAAALASSAGAFLQPALADRWPADPADDVPRGGDRA